MLNLRFGFIQTNPAIMVIQYFQTVLIEGIQKNLGKNILF